VSVVRLMRGAGGRSRGEITICTEWTFEPSGPDVWNLSAVTKILGLCCVRSPDSKGRPWRQPRRNILILQPDPPVTPDRARGATLRRSQRSRCYVAQERSSSAGNDKDPEPSMLARSHRDSLTRDGYAVLSGLVPDRLLTAARDVICTFISAELDRPETWYRPARVERSPRPPRTGVLGHTAVAGLARHVCRDLEDRETVGHDGPRDL
jgi:hypothetical protein